MRHNVLLAIKSCKESSAYLWNALLENINRSRAFGIHVPCMNLMLVFIVLMLLLGYNKVYKMNLKDGDKETIIYKHQKYMTS